MKHLLKPARIGDLTLNNSIAMAPLTRSRTGDAGVPSALNATYYGQRASAGMLITEATNVSPMSAAFEHAPGIYTEGQVLGWRSVAQEVHANGGTIFMQLWHGGRVSSYALLDGQAPLSPSGVNHDLGLLQVYGAMRNGYYTRISASPSRAMTREEILSTVQEFRTGAANAMRAGLDGVEIHAANGYLIQQFLSPQVNHRGDEFGGSVENRARLLRMIIEAVLEVVPAARIGVRVSPFALYNNAGDPDPHATYAYVANMLQEYGITYLHAADTNAWGGKANMPELLALLRPRFHGTLIANAGLTPETGEALIMDGKADMVAFGRQYVANPDLVARIAVGGPFNEPDPFTFYGGSEKGYTDYPALAAA
jgi:N-ethylmaleimide reductase